MHSKELIVNNYYIDADPREILEKLRSELKNGKLSRINYKTDNIQVTCPDHKGGMESRPSCFINLDPDKAPYLWVHCFTCGANYDFVEFVAHCFECQIGQAKRWLIDNFGSGFIKRDLQIDDIKIEKEKEEYLDESILNEFSNYHPYMTQRKLTEDIIKKFEIKYDSEYQAIVFPIRDLKGNLVGLSRRSVKGKRFWLPKNFDKSNIYLLYNIINENIKDVIVVESQLNALTAWGYGYPSIALFGVGTTDDQMKVLNNSGIKRFRLMYDSDSAGRKGAERFKKLIRKDVFVDDIILPIGKDVNDLTKEEFEKLLED